MDPKKEQIAAVFHKLSKEGQMMVRLQAESILKAETALRGQQGLSPEPAGTGNPCEGIPGIDAYPV